MILPVSESVIIQSAEMAEKDPHGAIITLVSVSVVFVALIVLYFAYTLIGKLASGEIKFKMPEKKKVKEIKGAPDGEIAAAIAMALDQEMNGEVYAAISMALHQYLNDTVHDNESYIITIKRKRQI